MPKSLILRAKDEALESPAVWLCVNRAIAHAKKLAAGRRHHAAHRTENNLKSSIKKTKRWGDESKDARKEQQEYRARKASGNFIPKQRTRGIDHDRARQRDVQYKEANKDRVAKRNHESYVRHKDKVLARTAARNKACRGTGSKHAIMILCRDRINGALKAGQKNGLHTSDLLGCTYEQYVSHLGPSYLRMKELDLVIDHIWPLALYDLQNPVEQKKAFNYLNTRLCSAMENRRKGGRAPDYDLAHTVPRELWPSD
jgi:hypothetical protein